MTGARVAGSLVALGVTLGAMAAHADQSLISLSRVTPVAMMPGDTLVVRGSVRTSIDGATIAPVDLFDAEAGGFRIAPPSADGVTRLVSTGARAAGCAVAFVASPCLVPRLGDVAHARLATVDDFARSLSGAITIDLESAPPVPMPPMARSTTIALSTAMGAIVLALLGFLSAAVARARRRTAIGQVYAAALSARKATRCDATLANVRAQIDDLLARADDLEKARRACAARLAGIDRVALEKKRASWASSSAAEAREPLDWLTAQLAEAARLESDLSSSIAGLERIAGALRVLTLRARSHRGTRARIARRDPVDALASELDRRDEAIAEVEHAIDSQGERAGARQSRLMLASTTSLIDR